MKKILYHVYIKRIIAMLMIAIMLISTGCSDSQVPEANDVSSKLSATPDGGHSENIDEDSNENNGAPDEENGSSSGEQNAGNDNSDDIITGDDENNDVPEDEEGSQGNSGATDEITPNGGNMGATAGNTGTSTSKPSGGQSTSTPVVTPKPDIPAENTKPKFSKMPVLEINTDGGISINSKDTYVTCKISSADCPDDYLFTDIAAGIRLRGNSTMGAEKKPYRIKFDKKQTLFGLNNDAKCKSWCLMADYFDHSMLRNYTAFNLGRAILDDLYYCSDAMHAEVYINGEYQGVYLVCEQSQINKNRVDIYEKADTETSLQIGYLMIGQGGRNDEEDSFVISLDKDVTDLNGTTLHLGSMNYSLSGGPYTDEQLRYIEKWSSAAVNTIWSALYENKYYTVKIDGTMVTKNDFPSGATTEQKQRLTIGAVIDIDSAVKMYVLDEIVKNFDAGTFNMYVDLSPTGNHKLTFAAPWDYDFALGNSRYATTYSPTDLYAANFTYSDGYRTNCLFVLLNNAEWFRDDAKKIWNDKYSDIVSALQDIKTVASFGKNQFNSNYKRWDTLGTSTMFHQSDDVYNYYSHMDAANQLYNWLNTRVNWLDSYWKGNIKQLDLSNIDFGDSSSANYIENMKRAYGKCDGFAYKSTVTDPSDPYYYVDYSKSSIAISSSRYKQITINCMVPQSNQFTNYFAEFFLVCGANGSAEAGKSFVINMPADGKYHTYTVDLSAMYFWSGKLNKVRVDFFNESVAGDVFYLKSIGFK